MPLAARAAAASSKAASRSADPAGTLPRRTTYVVMSLGASSLDSGGSRTHVRSVTATDSRRMACSPLFAAPGITAEHGAPSSGTRRGVRSRPHPATAAARARARASTSGREDGRPVISLKPTACVQDPPAPTFSLAEAAVVIFIPRFAAVALGILLRPAASGLAAWTQPVHRQPSPASTPSTPYSSERCSTCGTSATGRSPGSSSSVRRRAAGSAKSSAWSAGRTPASARASAPASGG